MRVAAAAAAVVGPSLLTAVAHAAASASSPYATLADAAACASAERGDVAEVQPSDSLLLLQSGIFQAKHARPSLLQGEALAEESKPPRRHISSSDMSHRDLYGPEKPNWADKSREVHVTPQVLENDELDVATIGLSAQPFYCHERTNEEFCWDLRPLAAVPCSADSGTEECECPVGPLGCSINELDSDPPTTAKCVRREVYVPRGVDMKPGKQHWSEGSATKVKQFCTNMTKLDAWQSRGLVPAHEDGADALEGQDWRAWLGCWYPYTWHNGECVRRRRFLGERCWDGLWNPFYGTAGVCHGSAGTAGSDAEDYAVSCFMGTCVPTSFLEAPHVCQCSVTSWRTYEYCGAQEGQCGGHPCRLDSEDGEHYCDFGAPQTW